jgi:hypothetical protein
MERVRDWCRDWNLPPRPEEVLDKTGPRHAEQWVFNALGYTLREWAATEDLDPERISLFPYPFGSLHQILPRPPINGFRPWWPTLEPWDVLDPETRKRVGYFHDARKALGLPQEKARPLLVPYKEKCEDILDKSGYIPVPQKRSSGAGRKLKGLEDEEARPEHDHSEHYAWLVEYQILRKARSAIVDSARPDTKTLPLDPSTVSRAIRKAASSLPLTLRTP